MELIHLGMYDCTYSGKFHRWILLKEEQRNRYHIMDGNSGEIRYGFNDQLKEPQDLNNYLVACGFKYVGQFPLHQIQI